MFGFGPMHPRDHRRLLLLPGGHSHTQLPTQNTPIQKPYLHVVLFHVDVYVRLPHGMAAAHERVSHRWLGLVGVVGVVVGYQAAQAGR